MKKKPILEILSFISSEQNKVHVHFHDMHEQTGGSAICEVNDKTLVFRKSQFNLSAFNSCKKDLYSSISMIISAHSISCFVLQYHYSHPYTRNKTRDILSFTLLINTGLVY